MKCQLVHWLSNDHVLAFLMTLAHGMKRIGLYSLCWFPNSDYDTCYYMFHKHYTPFLFAIRQFQMQAYTYYLMKMYVPARRLADFEVTVSNISFPVTRNDFIGTSALVNCGQYPSYPAAGTWGRVTCTPGPISGRFVFISSALKHNILTLCELKVFAGMFFKIYRSLHLEQKSSTTRFRSQCQKYLWSNIFMLAI